MKTTTLVLASIAMFATLSQAIVLVSEDFGYSDGALNGQNGGTGFSGAWTSNTNVTGGVATGNNVSTRNLAAPAPSTGTLWLSFDWGFSAQPTGGNSYGGLTFFAGSTERFLIGNTFPFVTGGYDLWQMNNVAPGLSAQTSVTNYPVMKTGVARITLGVGATSTVDLWVGPTGSPVDVTGAPMATSTNRDLAGIDSIRING